MYVYVGSDIGEGHSSRGAKITIAMLVSWYSIITSTDVHAMPCVCDYDIHVRTMSYHVHNNTVS